MWLVYTRLNVYGEDILDVQGNAGDYVLNARKKT